MRTCRYSGADCKCPHLKCEACPVFGQAVEGLAAALEPPVGFLSLPDPYPYVKFGSPSGRPGFGIEIGLKGTF